jgi:imidazolonepropionase-like amidohydrolase/ABC-type multidrug transport system permease subunit
MNAYMAQIRMNLRLTLRDRTVLFFSYLFPLGFFFIFGQVMHAERGGAIVQIVNMVLTIGILGTGFFGAGMRTVMEREQNILRRFKVAPISSAPILVSSLITGLVLYIPVTVVILTLAHVVYGLPQLEHPVSLYVFILLGVAAFRAMGGIIGATANSMQESQVIIQVLYFPMLFLGGSTFPIAIMPSWLQTVAQFIPTSYLSTGLTGILQGHETIFDNLAPAGALGLTALVGTFLAVKLFRWEKEEKMRASAKLWLFLVLGPFLILGAWQMHTKDNLVKGRALARDMRRNRTLLIRNARLFIGDGSVIERGSVLVKDGRIGEVYTTEPPGPDTVKAAIVDAAGKTLLPGLIDVHVHLNAPGGVYASPSDYTQIDRNVDRELAAYLYSGVTAVKSAGDATDTILKHRASIASGEKAGAEVFLVGPIFTAAGGYGTQYLQSVPEQVRPMVEAQLLRFPESAEEARQQVAELKALGVNGIKAILDSGDATRPLPRMESGILDAIAQAARSAGLPIVCHTSTASDVADALNAGVNGIEHGSDRELIPEPLFARMKQMGVTYDPTLASFEASSAMGNGKSDLLDRSLVQQVGPPGLLQATRLMVTSRSVARRRAGAEVHFAGQNLAAAWRSGVTLVAGTDSGIPMMVHGPGIHREMQLWVESGVRASVALQAATYNGARLLLSGDRIGLIRKGYEANLLLVDGDPLQDISATERISVVVFKGERVDRSELFTVQ